MAALDGAKYCKQLIGSSSNMSACVSPDSVYNRCNLGRKNLDNGVVGSSCITARLSQLLSTGYGQELLRGVKRVQRLSFWKVQLNHWTFWSDFYFLSLHLMPKLN